MSLSLAVNSHGDIFVAADGTLGQTRDLFAVMQACQHAAQTLRGEMVYATDDGLPNFDTVWNGSPNLAQFEAYLRRALLSVGGVVRVSGLAVTVRDRAVQYRAVIQTIYGTGNLNG